MAVASTDVYSYDKFLFFRPHIEWFRSSDMSTLEQSQWDLKCETRYLMTRIESIKTDNSSTEQQIKYKNLN